MLKEINSWDQAEIPLMWDPATPNGTIMCFKHLIHTMLDASRPALNLGAYTCRDLDYLKPICRAINKPIECVESWSPVRTDALRLQLISEIEAKYGREGIDYCWADASESQTIDTADWILFSTSWDYPIERTMLQDRHPTVWVSTGASYLWPRIGTALERGDIQLLFRSECIVLTNSKSIKEQWMETHESIALPPGWWWEPGGELINLRRRDSMQSRWDRINDLST